VPAKEDEAVRIAVIGADDVAGHAGTAALKDFLDVIAFCETLDRARGVGDVTSEFRAL
jgi:hypothetical protein